MDEFGNKKSGKIYPLNSFMKGLIYRFRLDPKMEIRAQKIRKMKRIGNFKNF